MSVFQKDHEWIAEVRIGNMTWQSAFATQEEAERHVKIVEAVCHEQILEEAISEAKQKAGQALSI